MTMSTVYAAVDVVVASSTGVDRCDDAVDNVCGKSGAVATAAAILSRFLFFFVVVVLLCFPICVSERTTVYRCLSSPRNALVSCPAPHFPTNNIFLSLSEAHSSKFA